jgi:glyoxylate reductase
MAAARPVVLVRHRFPGDTTRLEQACEVRVANGLLRTRILAGSDRDAQALWTFGERIDDELLDTLPQLRVVANHGVGIDSIDAAALRRRGVALIVPRGANADAVADHTIGLLIALRHRILEGDRLIRRGDWGRRPVAEPLGDDVFATTLGIVGLGSIGEAVARRATGFRMRIVYHNRSRRRDLEASLGVEPVSLGTLLQVADAVTLHCPLTDATRGLISDREFALMRPSSVLVNTARGAIVDEDALIRAVTRGVIAGAALDVFSDEPRVPPALLDGGRVVVTPHIADWTVATNEEITRRLVRGMLEQLGV